MKVITEVPTQYSETPLNIVEALVFAAANENNTYFDCLYFLLRREPDVLVKLLRSRFTNNNNNNDDFVVADDDDDGNGSDRADDDGIDKYADRKNEDDTDSNHENDWGRDGVLIVCANADADRYKCRCRCKSQKTKERFLILVDDY